MLSRPPPTSGFSRRSTASPMAYLAGRHRGASAPVFGALIVRRPPSIWSRIRMGFPHSAPGTEPGAEGLSVHRQPRPPTHTRLWGWLTQETGARPGLPLGDFRESKPPIGRPRRKVCKGSAVEWEPPSATSLGPDGGRTGPPSAIPGDVVRLACRLPGPNFHTLRRPRPPIWRPTWSNQL